MLNLREHLRNIFLGSWSFEFGKGTTPIGFDYLYYDGTSIYTFNFWLFNVSILDPDTKDWDDKNKENK